MKLLKVFLLSPSSDASPSQVYPTPPAFHQTSLTVGHFYFKPWGHHMVHYAHQRALSNSNARASGSERKNDEKRKPHVIGFVLGVDLNLTIKISFDMISIKRKKEKDFLFLINSRFSHLFMNFYLRQRISLKNCSSNIVPWWPKMSSDYDHKRYLSLIWSSSASLLDNRGVSSCGSPLAVSALPSSLASQSNTTSTV